MVCEGPQRLSAQARRLSLGEEEGVVGAVSSYFFISCLVFYLFHFLFIFCLYSYQSVCSALFYKHHPDAAKTKKGSTSSVSASSGPAFVPAFPTSGWSSDSSLFPTVTATTMLAHLIRTGKSVSSETGDDGVVLVKKPVDRAHEFFFGGYVHDVAACRVNADTFVKSKCFAPHRNNVTYDQQLHLRDDSSDGAGDTHRSTAVMEKCGPSFLRIACPKRGERPNQRGRHETRTGVSWTGDCYSQERNSGLLKAS